MSTVPPAPPRPDAVGLSRAVTAGVAAALLIACGTPGPRPIAMGSDACAHCHMTIADSRFTAEAITTTGKTIVFDDVGCLAAWLQESGTPIASAWVTSFVDHQTWLSADSAVYLRTESVRTPMASGLIALRTGDEADSVRGVLGGPILSWQQVRSTPLTHRLPTAP